MSDPNRVDPAEHRGYDVGLLSIAFRLAERRADHDITGPRPLPRLLAELAERDDE